MKIRILTILLATISTISVGTACANLSENEGNTSNTENISQSNISQEKENISQEKESISQDSISQENSTTLIATASNIGPFYTEGGVAIDGADPVAYFQQGRYIRGSSQHSYQWNNVTWHFSSAQNRDLFASNPEAYAPQYGGYCAWAVSRGYSAPIDPNAWKIVDGKLYLNYSKRVQGMWERDISGNISKADRNWPNVASKL